MSDGEDMGDDEHHTIGVAGVEEDPNADQVELLPVGLVAAANALAERDAQEQAARARGHGSAARVPERYRYVQRDDDMHNSAALSTEDVAVQPPGEYEQHSHNEDDKQPQQPQAAAEAEDDAEAYGGDSRSVSRSPDSVDLHGNGFGPPIPDPEAERKAEAVSAAAKAQEEALADAAAQSGAVAGGCDCVKWVKEHPRRALLLALLVVFVLFLVLAFAMLSPVCELSLHSIAISF